MQYVGQTDNSRKTGLCAHFCKMKKPKQFDTCLSHNFKDNGNLPSKVLIQPVEFFIGSKHII